jgi:hypothetical protein
MKPRLIHPVLDASTASAFAKHRATAPRLARTIAFNRLPIEAKEALRNPECPLCRGLALDCERVYIRCSHCQLGEELGPSLVAQRVADLAAGHRRHQLDLAKASGGIVLKATSTPTE